MISAKLSIFLLFLAIAPAQAALFGPDLRQPITPSSPQAALGSATAVAVLTANIEPSSTKPGTFKLNTDPLSGLLCRDERFAATDPTLSYSCSGFLVAPDLIVTAGHCMVNTGEAKNETDTYCAVFGWLFDYQTDGHGQVALDGIAPEKFFKCKQVVYAIREEKAPFRDYALVQLERPVPGRQPFALAADPVRTGESLAMIGYPFGTPMKYSPFAPVTMNDPSRQSFLTHLDAFEGNSGSAVFNQKNQVVGILIGGTPSNNTVTDQGGQCERLNRCDANGQNCTLPDPDTTIFPGYQGVGSEVQRIGPVLELIRAFSPKP